MPNTPDWTEAGHAEIRDFLSADRIATMRSIIDAMLDHGLHPIFSYVYDAFWTPAVQLREFASTVLGPCQITCDGWVWKIPPASGNRGWHAHRDWHRGMMTAWLALSDTDVDSACMHIVPLDRDPAYAKGQLNDESAADRAIALPARAGTALFWDAHALHWGGYSSDRATQPRVSVSYTFVAIDSLDQERRPVKPDLVFDFKARPDVIASIITRYRHHERVDRDVEDWAKLVSGLGQLRPPKL